MLPETKENRLPPVRLYECLVPSPDRALLRRYTGYLALLLRRGLGQKGRHPKSFNLLYRAVSRSWGEKTLLGGLQKAFIARNVSLSLLLEPLDGFEWLSKNRYPLELSAASPIWLQIVSPLARLVAVLNNQQPPFYQPFADLAFIAAARYLLAAPELSALLQKNGITVDEARLQKGLPLLQKESLQLLSVTSWGAFRLKISFFIGLGRVLSQTAPDNGWKKINFFAYVNAFLYGLWHTLTVNHKTRGLDKL